MCQLQTDSREVADVLTSANIAHFSSASVTSAYCVSGTVLGAGKANMNKTAADLDFAFLLGKKHIHRSCQYNMEHAVREPDRGSQKRPFV